MEEGLLIIANAALQAAYDELADLHSCAEASGAHVSLKVISLVGYALGETDKEVKRIHQGKCPQCGEKHKIEDCPKNEIPDHPYP